jgi:drug/metabolite transporter (DMT)-like permease
MPPRGVAVVQPAKPGAVPRRPAGAGVAAGTGAMICVGGSVAVSGVLAHAPVFTAEALPERDGVPDPAGHGPAGRHGPWGVSVHTTWIAAVIFAVIGLTHEGPGAAARLGTEGWLAVGYLAVAVTAAAFVLWYSSVERLGASRAGLLTGVAPVAAAAAGVLLGDPPPRPLIWAGIAVVAAGLALGLRGPAQARDSSRPDPPPRPRAP